MSSQEIEIKRFMAQKLKEGESLSDIQKLVNETFGTRMTFLDVRILASELENVDWSALDPAPVPQKEKVAEEETLPPDGGGETHVEISKLVRPGMALSGTVRFRNGTTAEWYVDAYGRLGFENLQGERPGEEDLRDFQTELQRQLGR